MSLLSLALAYLERQKRTNDALPQQVSQRDSPRGVPAGQKALTNSATNTYGVLASVPGGTVANRHWKGVTSVPRGTMQQDGTNGTLGTVGTSGTVN
jgi:hypothetical protein